MLTVSVHQDPRTLFPGTGTATEDLPGVRPLTARSVLASTLLGTDPPPLREPLRECGEAGDVHEDQGAVELAPRLVEIDSLRLVALPDSDHASLTVWLANLTLTQVYVPLTLTAFCPKMYTNFGQGGGAIGGSAGPGG